MVRSSLFADGLFGFQGILKSSMIKCGHLGLSSTRKSPSFILFMQKQLTISCVPSHMVCCLLWLIFSCWNCGLIRDNLSNWFLDYFGCCSFTTSLNAELLAIAQRLHIAWDHSVRSIICDL